MWYDAGMVQLLATANDQTALVDTREAAKLLGLAKQTLDVWRVSGRVRVPFIKLGHAVRYRRSDLQAFVESRVVTD